MPVCKNCGKPANSMNFCPDCGTSVHVLSDKEYQEFLDKRQSGQSKSQSKKFICNQCSKRFRTHQGLISHQQTLGVHTPYKTYFCKSCSRKFSTEFSLIHHRIVAHNESFIGNNSSEMKFYCEKCFRKFRSEGALIQHLMMVHNKSLNEIITSNNSSDNLVLKTSNIIENKSQ
jgi:5-methylcytosine-specific restriction endonuclease McrA